MFVRLNRSLKGLILIGLGVFLFSRINSGTLLFYINQRFAWLTWLAAVLFLLLGAAYHGDRAEDHEHPAEPDADHAHAHGGQTPWRRLAIVALPLVLGLLVPPRPLGASALGNRELSVSLTADTEAQGLTRAPQERDILDWLGAFASAEGPEPFAGQLASVIGFVYHQANLPAGQFLLSRFVVVCCVADAAPVGLTVVWPQAAELKNDTWVRVSGHFEAERIDEQGLPILAADEVTPIDPPQQPYLYP